MTAKKLSAREAERILLHFMVERPAVREVVREKLGTIAFEPQHQALRERIESLAQTKSALSWTDLADACAGQAEALKLVSDLSFADYERWQGDEVGLQIDDSLQTLEFEFWQRELETLKRRIKAGEVEDIVAASRRLQEIQQYLQQRGTRIDTRRKNQDSAASRGGEES